MQTKRQAFHDPKSLKNRKPPKAMRHEEDQGRVMNLGLEDSCHAGKIGISFTLNDDVTSEKYSPDTSPAKVVITTAPANKEVLFRNELLSVCVKNQQPEQPSLPRQSKHISTARNRSLAVKQSQPLS